MEIAQKLCPIFWFFTFTIFNHLLTLYLELDIDSDSGTDEDEVIEGAEYMHKQQEAQAHEQWALRKGDKQIAHQCPKDAKSTTAAVSDKWKHLDLCWAE